jgi:hypothetical protein
MCDSVANIANSSRSPSGAGAAPPALTPALELESWNWHQEYGYAIVDGSVKNISSESMKNVEAVVTFTTKSGEHITSSSALIQYNPILPGQTSPFKVMQSWNPAMTSASMDFHELMGGSIAWKQREHPKPKPKP